MSSADLVCPQKIREERKTLKKAKHQRELELLREMDSAEQDLVPRRLLEEEVLKREEEVLKRQRIEAELTECRHRNAKLQEVLCIKILKAGEYLTCKTLNGTAIQCRRKFM